MTDKSPVSKEPLTADRLFRGLLTKVGDTFDRFTGRRWIPSSSLATSELIERLKKLLDAEAKQVAGKGLVVPHNIILKMQWDKFSDDAEKGIDALRTELLTAAADHINDSLYYTFAPVTLVVKTDYFTEGVKLSVSFDKFDKDDHGVEMNVTMPSIDLAGSAGTIAPAISTYDEIVKASYVIRNVPMDTKLVSSHSGRISVGRTSENMLVLDDPSVSKMHASVIVSADGLAVADTGSTNGTFINDERIAYGRSVSFGSAGRVKFGDVEVSFEHIPQPLVESAGVIEPVDDTVEIGGFEFKSRKPSQADAEAQPARQPSVSGLLSISPIEIDGTDGRTASDAEGFEPGTAGKPY